MKLNKVPILFFLLKIVLFSGHLFGQENDNYRLYLCEKLIENKEIMHIVTIGQNGDTSLVDSAIVNGFVDIKNRKEIIFYLFYKKKKVYKIKLDTSKFELFDKIDNILCFKPNLPQNMSSVTILLGSHGIGFYSEKVRYSSVRNIRKKFNF